MHQIIKIRVGSEKELRIKRLLNNLTNKNIDILLYNIFF